MQYMQELPHPFDTCDGLDLPSLMSSLSERVGILSPVGAQVTLRGLPILLLKLQTSRGLNNKPALFGSLNPPRGTQFTDIELTAS